MPLAEADGPAAASLASWRRLDRRMLVLHPIQELIRAIPWLVALLIAGGSSGHGSLWGLAGVAVVIFAGGLRWFTTTYRITPEQVQVRRGLIRRQTLTVLRDRVRTVDVSANALHRLLGLARVTIGTGRSDRKDDGGLKLDGLSSEECVWVRQELLDHHPTRPAGSPYRQSEAPSDSATEVELALWDPRWIVYGPLTLSGLITLAAVVGFGYRIASEANINPGRVGPVHDLLGSLGATSPALLTVVVSIAAMVLIGLASAVGYVLAFWNYRLTRQSTGTLHVTRGLLTTRSVTLDERRLRGVELSEPLLLRAAHGARCIAIATGLRVGRGAEVGGSMLVPPAPRKLAETVAATILGDMGTVTGPLAPHGPMARRRRYTRLLLLGSAALVALVAGWQVGPLPAWPWQVVLVLLLASPLLAADRYRSLGHAVVGGRLVTRWGSLVRRRCILASDGIIGWNIHQSFFQRRVGLVTLTATTAAGRQGYQIQDITLAEAVRVAESARPGLLSVFVSSGPAIAKS